MGGLSAMFHALPATKQSWSGGLSAAQVLGYFLPLFLLVATTIVSFPSIKPDTAVLVLGAKGVPDALGGFILAATVGLIITTGNSYLLSSAGNLVHDLYLNIAGRRINESRQLTVDRSTVVVLGIIAYCLGTFFPSVLAIQIYSYTMYGAAITPALIAALTWRKATVAGGIASILMGGVATLVWDVGLSKPLDWNSVLISLPLSIITLIIVSLATQSQRTELVGGDPLQDVSVLERPDECLKRVMKGGEIYKNAL